MVLTDNSSVVANDTHRPQKYPHHQRERAVWTYLHARHGTKTTPVFLPDNGEASWSLFPSLISLLSGGTVQLENTYSCILKVTEKDKKG